MSLLNFARTCSQKGSEKCPETRVNFRGFLKSLLKVCFISEFCIEYYSYKLDSTFEFVFSSIGLRSLSGTVF